MLSRVDILTIALIVNLTSIGALAQEAVVGPVPPPAEFTQIDRAYNEGPRKIIESKCYACHSDQIEKNGHPANSPVGLLGNVPLIGKIVTNVIDDEIKKGREQFDYSTSFPFKGEGTVLDRLGRLDSITKNDSMPPAPYRYVHRGEVLTEEDKQIISKWATESKAIIEKIEDPKIIEAFDPELAKAIVLAKSRPVDSGPASPSAKKAHGILKKYCGECHADGKSEGGFDYVLDLNKMVRFGKIKPNDLESQMIQKIKIGNMPPAGNPAPSPAEIAALESWIKEGAPGNFQDGAGQAAVVADEPPLYEVQKGALKPEVTGTTFSAHQDTLSLIQQDLGKAKAVDRPFIRYISIKNDASKGPDGIGRAQAAVSKMINHLSWGPKVVPPTAVDEAGTLLRIDLRDYLWDTKKWDFLANRSPHKDFNPDDKAFKDIAETVGSNQPFLRGDWFVAESSKASVYHTLLDFPKNKSGIEEALGINVAENQRAGKELRAGFLDSGVSNSNRVIGRHDTPHGAYWESYDFDKSAGDKNLFASPFHPGDFGDRFQSDKFFKHAGGEIIFNLPNGLQGYVLVETDGKIIEKAPIAIVSDPSRPDRAVENGISCIGCHVKGMIPKKDEVGLAPNRSELNAQELAELSKRYPDEVRQSSFFDGDIETFVKAIKQARVNPDAPEPVSALVRDYESSMNIQEVASELSITEDELKELLRTDSRFKRELGRLLEDKGRVKRDSLNSVLGDLQNIIVQKNIAQGSRASICAECITTQRGADTRNAEQLIQELETIIKIDQNQTLAKLFKEKDVRGFELQFQILRKLYARFGKALDEGKISESQIGEELDKIMTGLGLR